MKMIGSCFPGAAQPAHRPAHQPAQLDYRLPFVE